MTTKPDRSSLNIIETGPVERGTVVLIHAVGLDLTFWNAQIDAVRQHYRVVSFDLPGHGRSQQAFERWTFEQTASFTAEVIASVATGPVHLVGISFGGMVAQATALARPDLVRSLTLIGTACTFSDEVRAGMRLRAQAIRSGGMDAVLASSLERWFTPETRFQLPHLVDRVSKTVLADDPGVQAAIWEVIATLDFCGRLHEIQSPTLILVGAADPSTPPAAAKVLEQHIPHSRLVVIDGASHMVNLEAPDAVNAELLLFLDSL